MIVLRSVMRFATCAVLLLTMCQAGWGQAGSASASSEDGESSRPRIVIRYGGDRAFKPYEWVTTDGRADGFQIELIRAIGRAIDAEIDVRLGAWEAIREDMLSGRLDVVSTFDRPWRREYLDFAVAHAVETSEIFTRRDGPAIRSLNDLRGRSVLVRAGALAEEAQRQLGAETVVVPVGSELEALKLLGESDRYDAAVVTRSGGRLGVRERASSRVVSTALPMHTGEIAFAVRKGDEQTLALVNAGLAKVRASGELERLKQKWFGQGGRPEIPLARAVADASYVVVPLLVGVLLLLAWSWSLKRVVRTATGKLHQELVERSRAETALRDSEERFRVALKSSSITVYHQDRELRYTWMYNAGPGRGTTTLLGRTDSEILPPELAERVIAIKRRVISSGVGERTELQVPTIEGSRWIELVAEPLRAADGRVIGLTCAEVDISALKSGEEQKLALERRVAQSRKLESLGLMAGGIAHDFNNLLMGVMGNASMARAEVARGSRAAELIETIEQTARMASDLTRQLLAFTGQGQVGGGEVQLNDLLDETARVIRGSLSAAVKLVVDADPKLGVVTGDATQVRQVVMNLVKNAADAIGPGGGTVRIATRAVRVDEAMIRSAEVEGEASPGEYVVIDVSDDGKGMDASTIARIFDPFFTTKPGGKGLGLAVVAGAVRRHRGLIKVTSRPGAGSMFSVMLPAPRTGVRRNIPGASHGSATASGPRAGSRGTVLVVEDQVFVRDVVQQTLERGGYAVIAARTGQEAFDALSRHGPDLSAIVVDLALPDVSGARVLERVRASSARIGVVVVSGLDDPAVRTTVSTDPLSVFLQKPFTPPELMYAVERVTARAGQNSTP